MQQDGRKRDRQQTKRTNKQKKTMNLIDNIPQERSSVSLIMKKISETYKSKMTSFQENFTILFRKD